MKLTEYERNLIRCSVSLSVPIVLDYISHHSSDINSIRHMLPAYTLFGCSSEISPYFTPANLKDTGKRRVYVNSDGYRIRYLAIKELYRFNDSASRWYDKADIKAVYSKCANRWVIMKGHINDYHNNFERFVNSLVLVESDPSKNNHPPTGAGMFTYPDLTFGFDTSLRPKPIFDLMSHGEVRLERYKLIQLKTEEPQDVSDV